jgi:hypothetical protein
MNVAPILILCLTGAFSIQIRSTEATPSGSPVPREESGVMTHGTIFEISNSQIMVLPLASHEPVRHFHGEGTVYVDDSENPVTLKSVKSGFMVTVFYSGVADHRIANRVVVGDFVAAKPENHDAPS